MTGLSVLSLSQAVLAFAAYAVAVLAGLRLAPRIEPALLVVAAALAVCVAAVPLLALVGPGMNLWVFLVGYWFLVTAFVMAFGAVYKSLSLRILMDLLARPGRSDDYNDLFSRYLVQDSYQNRLAVIREKDLVLVRGGLYDLTPRGRSLATRVRAVQRRFGITRSG